VCLCIAGGDSEDVHFTVGEAPRDGLRRRHSHAPSVLPLTDFSSLAAHYRLSIPAAAASPHRSQPPNTSYAGVDRLTQLPLMEYSWRNRYYAARELGQHGSAACCGGSDSGGGVEGPCLRRVRGVGMWLVSLLTYCHRHPPPTAAAAAYRGLCTAAWRSERAQW
jgi:hypothetical protein